MLLLRGSAIVLWHMGREYEGASVFGTGDVSLVVPLVVAHMSHDTPADPALLATITSPFYSVSAQSWQETVKSTSCSPFCVNVLYDGKQNWQLYIY